MIYHRRANVWPQLAELCGNIQSIDCKEFDVKVLYARSYEQMSVRQFADTRLWSATAQGKYMARTMPLVTKVVNDVATRDKHVPVVIVFHSQRPLVDTIAHEAAHAAMLCVRMHSGKTWWGQFDTNGDHDEQIAYLTGHIAQEIYSYTRGRNG